MVRDRSFIISSAVVNGSHKRSSMKRGQRNPNSQGAFRGNKVADKRPGPQRRASLRMEDDLMTGAAETMGAIA